MKRVQDHASRVGKRIRLDDVHAPAGKHAGNRGEERGSIRRKQRERERVARRDQFGLHWLRAQLLVQREVRGDLRRRMHGQIPSRESFQEPLDLFEGCLASKRLHPLQHWNFIGCVQPVAIQRPAEVVRSRHKKLPQHFRFPRRQRFRIHGMNVRVGQQAQSFQSLLRPHGLRKNGNGRRVKNVPSLHCGGHVQVVLDEKMHLRPFLGRKFQTPRRAIQSREAAGDVILHRHPFAHVMQQKRQNKQVAPIDGFPERCEMRPARIGRIGKFL